MNRWETSESTIHEQGEIGTKTTVAYIRLYGPDACHLLESSAQHCLRSTTGRAACGILNHVYSKVMFFTGL